MSTAFKDKIDKLNGEHKYVHFVPLVGDDGRPVSISIRFQANRFQQLTVSRRDREVLFNLVETASRYTMLVTTDERLFNRGVIDIAVLSMAHNYRSDYVSYTLRTIAEEIFKEETR